MWQFSETVDGLAEACTALGTPSPRQRQLLQRKLWQIYPIIVPFRLSRQLPDGEVGERAAASWFAKSFVVEADVAAVMGVPRAVAGFGEALDGFAELPHHFGFFRGCRKLEAIRRGDGRAPLHATLRAASGDGVHRADAGIELAPAAVAVGGKPRARASPRPFSDLDAYDSASLAPGPARVFVRNAVSYCSVDPEGLEAIAGRRQRFRKFAVRFVPFRSNANQSFSVFDAWRRCGDEATIYGPFFGERMRGNFPRRLGHRC